VKLRTFKLGGIHPEENKISAGSSIETLKLPESVSIPLSQNLGAPSAPAVSKGDKVKVGTLIGRGEAFISANVHSSVSGTVAKVDTAPDISGYRVKAVIIKVEGDEWEDSIDRSSNLVKETKLEQKEIIEKVKAAGIVGMGGACFPTHVKYMVPEGKKIDTILINGVECEPYLTSDHRLMLERTDEILVGIEILKKAMGVTRAVICIEANKMDAVEKLRERIKDYQGIELAVMKLRYPQGAEKQLIKAILNREVPSLKLPLDVGCVVNNVGTTLAVYEAVQKNKPLIERVVTVTGKNLQQPANFRVRIGTPVKDLLEAAGGMPEGTGKVISGGPMMGKAITSLDVPVIKGTSGVTVLDQSDAKRRETLNCIRCAKCVSACPMGLEPQLLEKLSTAERWEDAENENVVDCVECGSCSYTCPSARPLLDLIRLAKGKVMKMMRERVKK
jgi:electron transport complex protein RnfC